MSAITIDIPFLMAWQIRYGQGDAAVETLVRECGRKLLDVAGVRPTQLFSRNADVDKVNSEEMAVRSAFRQVLTPVAKEPARLLCFAQ